MSKSTEQLILVLDKEFESYERYRILANEKTQIIIDGDTSKLDKITIKEEQLIEELKKFDMVRNLIIGNFLKENNMDRVEDLGDIIHLVEDKYKEKLFHLRNKLKENLLEIQRINKLNEDLINNSLDYLDFNMNLFTSLRSSQIIYDKKDDNVQYTDSLFDGKG